MKKITLLLAFMLTNLCAFSQFTTIIDENFNGSTLPAGWIMYNHLGSTNFTFGSNDVPGTNYSFYTNAAVLYNQYGVHNRAYLRSPSFDASTYSKVLLQFDYALSNSVNNGLPNFRALLTDGGFAYTIVSYHNNHSPTQSNTYDIKKLAVNWNLDITNLSIYFLYDDEGFLNCYGGVGIDNVSILGTPPTNNSCGLATPLTLGNTFADNAITVDNFAATPSGEIVPDCISTYGFGTGEDIWFTVTPVSGSVTIETAPITSGAAYIDTVISAYSGTCGSFTVLDCDDDGGVGPYSKLVLTELTPNVPIYIRVNEFGTNAEGYFQISAYDTAPTNDDCTGATVLSDFYTTSVTLSGEDATSATNNAGFITLGGSCGAGMNDGVWYTFTAAHTGEVTLNVSPTAWDPEIGVYTGSCGNFVCLGNVDNGYNGDAETITFNVEFDTTYYINVGHYSSNTDNAEGVFDLEISYSCSAIPTNDMCGTAYDMSSVFNNPYNESTSVDATCATGGIVSSCGNDMNDGVWFKFTASDTGDISITITPDNSWDPQIAVYSGDCNNLVCVETIDDSYVNGGVETISVSVTNGTTYYVNVGHWSALDNLIEGFFSIDASFNSTTVIEDESINNLEIFPNPVTDLLTIQAQESISKVSVYNQIGQLVKEVDPYVDVNNTQVDLSNLNKGVYLVKIKLGENTQVKRIIKK